MPRRKKKKTKIKTNSQYSLILRFLFALFAFIVALVKGAVRLFIWFVIISGRNSKKNPLAAVGLFGFFLVFTFVGMNALFQPSSLIAPEKVVLPLEKPVSPTPEKSKIHTKKPVNHQEKEDELAKIIKEMGG